MGVADIRRGGGACSQELATDIDIVPSSIASAALYSNTLSIGPINIFDSIQFANRLQ
jgi:hypothetical protein